MPRKARTLSPDEVAEMLRTDAEMGAAIARLKPGKQALILKQLDHQIVLMAGSQENGTTITVFEGGTDEQRTAMYEMMRASYLGALTEAEMEVNVIHDGPA